MGKIIALVVAVVVVVIAAATIDSCNRHDRQCFGVMNTK